MTTKLQDAEHRETLIKSLLEEVGVEILPNMTSPVEVRGEDQMPMLAQAFRTTPGKLNAEYFATLGWKKFAFFQSEYHPSALEATTQEGLITVRGWVEK